MERKYIKKIFEYILVTCLSIIILIIILELWKADLSIPFIYSGDALFSGALIKGMIQNGWYLDNPYIGMPTGLNFRDYPLADNLHFIILKIISFFFPDHGITLNLFYLITFPLTALTTYFVLNHFGFPFIISLMGSLIYCFIPNHFYRNVGHLFLSAYYMIPLMVLVIIWVAHGKSPLFKGEKKIFKLLNYNKLLISAIVICFLVSSSGIYFSYFACFFLFIAGIISYSNQKNKRSLFIAWVLILIIFVGTIINISPSLIHWYKNGKNPEIAQRSFFEPELYGLKLTQLLFPIKNHRISCFSGLKEDYNRNAPLINENDWVSLGIIGSIGFLFLLSAVFVDRFRNLSQEISIISYLNLAGFLLSTIGGFSTLIAFMFPEIRAYNRISFYISFFSIFAISSLLNGIYKRYFFKKKLIFYIFVVFLITIGIFDQTSPSFVPPYEAQKVHYYEQIKFIKNIEASLPPKAMIFQMPYFPFPEHPPVNKMQDYDHFGGGYLFSKELRWSYGAIKGREGDLWQKMILKKPLDDLLETLVLTGFKAIYIDRYGYKDEAKSLEKKIQELVCTSPFISPNKRYAIYNLIEFEKKLKNKYSADEWELRKEKALHPLFITWGEGFYGEEGTKENSWRWCSKHGILIFNNSWKETRKVEIQMNIATGYEEFSSMKIAGDLISANIQLNSKGIFIKKEILIPPGKHIINFQTNAPQVFAPEDSRKLFFRIDNFQYKELY